jgi:hypothetical protein
LPRGLVSGSFLPDAPVPASGAAGTVPTRKAPPKRG